MSKTDKTKPWRLACDPGGCKGYPCKHIPMTTRTQVLRRKAWKRSRTQLRSDLAHGREPSTVGHRHSAHWERI